LALIIGMLFPFETVTTSCRLFYFNKVQLTNNTWREAGPEESEVQDSCDMKIKNRTHRTPVD